MKLGILQGRLSEPVDNHIQEFPNNWKNEFNLLDQLNLKCVEWLITKKTFLSNPLFYENLRNLPISSVCVDNIVDTNISNKQFLEKNLMPVCDFLLKNNIKNITIPLLDESSLKDFNKRKEFIENISNILLKYKELNFSFETDLTVKELQQILEQNDNCYVTYDTGNITSFGIDHEEYINLLHDKINNIHLKDRTYNAVTKFPMTGDTDFDKIFYNLKKINYNGNYILQSARFIDGYEVETIKIYKKIFEKMYDKYF